MPFSLIPHRVFDRYTQITPQLLSSLGIKLLLCDLDYTLAPKSVPRPDAALHTWLENCRQAGITVMILSNNRSSRRVETFCRDTDVLGARRSGVLALMVEPLGGPVGAWNHVLHLLQRPFKAAAKKRGNVQ